MKCAKCGQDVPAGALRCPWCASGGPAYHRTEKRACCPQCSSTDISAVRRTYDPGCGCLGLLIFGWIGLLLGLLGAGKVDLVCRNCGTTWEAGTDPRKGGCGCGALLLLILLILLLKHLCF